MDNQTLQNQFKASLLKNDLAAKTITGYAYDVKFYTQWLEDFYQVPVLLIHANSNDIRAYRENLSKILRQRPASINRRIQVVKRFYAWAKQEGHCKTDPAQTIRFARLGAPTKPQALTKQEVHVLLTSAGRSAHGLDDRNYALLQLLLQTGLRVGECVNLQHRDVVLYNRSGYVKVVDGKGGKYRDVPLNSTIRRALKSYLAQRSTLKDNAPLFITKRNKACTVRGIQKVIQAIATRTNITRVNVTCHTLRHTFATQYLQANPGNLVELSMLMGHESVNTTAIYTKASKEKLADGVERSEINLYGGA